MADTVTPVGGWWPDGCWPSPGWGRQAARQPTSAYVLAAWVGVPTLLLLAGDEDDLVITLYER